MATIREKMLDLKNNQQQTQSAQQTQPQTIREKMLAAKGLPPESPIKMPEMQTPQQMETQMNTDEQKLPAGAIGWNPDGTANYGSGIQGWWNGIASRVTAPVTEAGKEQPPSALDITGRVAGEAFGGLMSALSYPQQLYYGYLADRRSYEMYADMVNTNTPDLYSDNELGNFLRITTSLIPGISNLTTMMEKDRIKNGNRLLPDGTFEKIQEANRIWNKENVGTSLFDTQIQAEYIRRVLAGDDPYKVTKEWAKPLPNLVADLILDPLNVFDGLGIAEKFLGGSAKLTKGITVMDELKDAAKSLEEVAKLENTAENVAVVNKLINTVVDVVVGKSVKSIDNAKNISVHLAELTQSAKKVLLRDKLQGIMIPLAKFARGDGVLYDKMLMAIRQLGSEDAKIVEAGAQFLQDQKILHLFLSDNSMEAARFMNKMFENTADIRKLEKAVVDAEKTKYMLEFNKIADRVFEELYPDVNKVADALDKIEEIRKADPLAEIPQELKKFEGFTLSKTGRYIARQHKAMQESFLGTKVGVQSINSFFSTIYLTSPGFAARNYLNAAATAFIDLGPAGLRDMVDLVGSQKYIEDMFGLIPDSISKAFSAAGAGHKVEEAKGIMKPFAWMRNLASKGEEYESMAIAATAGKKYSNEMLREMKFIESMEPLRKAGFSNTALKQLESLIRKHNGKTYVALNEFKQMFKSGKIEHFREPEMIFSPELLNHINSFNEHYIDQLREIMKTGTLDEIIGKVDNFYNEILKTADNNIDMVSASYDAENTQDLIKTAMNIADPTNDVPDDVMNKIVDAVVGQVDEAGHFTGSPEELAKIAEDAGDAKAATEKAIKTLIGENGFTIKATDLFAKKETVRIHLYEAIKNMAYDVLSGEKRSRFLAETSQRASEIKSTQLAFSADIIELTKDVRSGRKSAKDIAKIIKTDQRFSRLNEFVPEITATTNPSDIPSLLWDYYRQYVGSLYNESNLEAYKLLNSLVVREGFGSIGNVNKAKMAMLDNQFETLFKYLHADSVVNGKAMINEPYYWYQRGELVKSVVARGKQLGLFNIEMNLGTQKAVSHKATIWSVVKQELSRLGLETRIGDINTESEYLFVMKELDKYAFKRNKLLSMRNVVNDFVKPLEQSVKDLKSIEITARTAEQGAELARLENKISSMNDIKRIISKKLYTGDVKDIEEFTTNFAEWWAKNGSSDTDILEIIGKNAADIVESNINIPKQEADMVTQVVNELFSNQPEIVREAQDAQKVLNEAKKIAKAKIGAKGTNIATNVADIPKLPSNLQGAKNFYNYGQNSFSVVFENDVDRALYYVGGRGKSKQHQQYYDFLKGIFGNETDKIVETYGKSIRNEIKKIASKSQPGEINLSRVFDDYAPYLKKDAAVLKEDQLAQAAADAIIKSIDETTQTVDNVANDLQKAADNVPENTANDMLTAIDQPPDLNDGNLKTPAQAISANQAGLQKMFDAVKQSISGNYGKSELVSPFSRETLGVLDGWAKRNEVKMLDFRMRALEYMKQTRDFALLDYAGGKRNVDLAMAYIFPYQFWYSRTYGNWMKRLVSNPNILARYAKYRNYLEQANKDLPSYMKDYLTINPNVFGLKDNPLMMNLEASLNPLNGLTGVDFTDKNKIVGTPGTIEYAMTKTLDSIGKFGPSPWSPYTMMMSAYLASKGEKEAAARWAGRLFPQSTTVKAIGSIFNQNWEFDPFVILFDVVNGTNSRTDPYESRRVGRALIAMKEAGQITLEQAYEAAKQKQGPIWEQALIQSTRNRALGTISAFTLGQGFKFRNKTDIEVDKFYEDYFKMWANKDKFTPDEMSNYQKYIRTKYPFADLVILSGKGSAERDRAYSYSVLSRIQPGQTGDIMNALGVNPNLVDKFYTDKGDMSQWNQYDKDGFMNAMAQIGTLLSIPNDTTVAQWQIVKTLYKQVDREIINKFGPDITSKIEAFYEFNYDSQEQKNYMEAHPEIQQALDYKDYLIGTNKQLAPYYDGLSRMERFYNGEFRRQVTQKIDPNYYEYYKIRSLIIDPSQLKEFDRQIGWSSITKRYNAFKKEWDLQIFKKLDQYDKFFINTNVPTTGQQNIENPSVNQQAIQQILSTQKEQERQITWQMVTSSIVMPATLDRAIQQYITNDRVFSSSENTMVGKLLNNVNQMYGLNLTKDDLLSLAMDYYQ